MKKLICEQVQYRKPIPLIIINTICSSVYNGTMYKSLTFLKYERKTEGQFVI